MARESKLPWEGLSPAEYEEYMGRLYRTSWENMSSEERLAYGRQKAINEAHTDDRV